MKRINPDAVLITSFYREELDSVFEIPLEIEGMTINLLDENNVIIYSTDSENIGNTIDSRISDLFEGMGNCAVFNNDYLVTSNICSNGTWKVVCSMPADILLDEVNFVNKIIYLVAGIMMIVIAVLAVMAHKKVSEPISNILEKLRREAEYDQLSGMLNKISYQNVVSFYLDSGEDDDKDAFIMLDMDNFKKINDNLGHDKGDEVLRRASSLMKDTFGDKYVMGRLGGDEFSFYKIFEHSEKGVVEQEVGSDIANLQNKFMSEFEDEHEQCGLSLSVGIAVIDAGKMKFDKIYKAADTALYNAKRGGKNQYRIYSGTGSELDE